MFYILDENNKPFEVDQETSIRWRRGYNRTVASTIKNDLFISTVFLGLDMGIGRGAPVLWETMVFKDGDSIDCERYTSHEDAVKGHEEMCRKYECDST